MQTKNIDWRTENHPDWYYDIPIMQTLILGSFPPHEKKRNFQFYYPNKQNHFWKILAALAKYDLHYFDGDKAVIERKAIMEKLQIGIENMGKTIKRKGTSAKDTDIEIVDFHDVLNILIQHTELNTVMLAGYSAPNSTYKSFCKFLTENGIAFNAPLLVKPGTSFTIQIKNRTIQCVITHSTSTATRIKLEHLISEFKSLI